MFGMSAPVCRSPIAPAVPIQSGSAKAGLIWMRALTILTAAEEYSDTSQSYLIWMRALTKYPSENLYFQVSQSYLIWMRALSQIYKKTTN